MTEKDILKYNKLIARFMYEKSFNDDGEDCYCESYNGMIDFYIENARYHKSWDWLIPVIDKIYSMNEYIEYKDYMNNIICDGGIDINTKFIQITFSDVVEFIKWYNNKIN